VLSYEQRFDEALEIARRAASLAGNDPDARADIGRVLLMARRWREADSLITGWSASPSTEMRVDALDLRMLLQRERGQFRAADRTADAAVAQFHDAEVFQIMKGNDLGRRGDWAGAATLYETLAHAHPRPGAALSPVSTLVGDWARAMCWEHALEADAIAGSGDTIHLRALADSIEMWSARSYYGRDWRLAHHVRGLIAMQGHRYAEAERELQAARWGVAGWTRTVAELAKAQLALGRPQNAIASLRDAYMGPLDAMGRYETRTELDFLMARAFRQAGLTDSARVYAGYVRVAWQDADPEVRQLLAQQPRGATPPHRSGRRDVAITRRPAATIATGRRRTRGARGRRGRTSPAAPDSPPTPDRVWRGMGRADSPRWSSAPRATRPPPRAVRRRGPGSTHSPSSRVDVRPRRSTRTRSRAGG
jgi:tetratricopeptide (TPR) repeat protein